MFLRFANMKRGQHLKEVDIVINETKELRVTEVRRGPADRGPQRARVGDGRWAGRRKGVQVVPALRLRWCGCDAGLSPS